MVPHTIRPLFLRLRPAFLLTDSLLRSAHLSACRRVDTHRTVLHRETARLHRRAVRQPHKPLLALLVILTLVALGTGAAALHYIEARLVATTGESLGLAASEIADKLDRILFERHGDVQMMARAFRYKAADREYLTDYLAWMKKNYPIYLWLGVTDQRGRIIAATDPSTVGRDRSGSGWFQSVRDSEAVHIGDVEPYEVAGGVDSVAFTAPIVDQQGTFLGTVSTRVGLPAMEDVLTSTIRTFQTRQGLGERMEYQFLSRAGLAFIDSDLRHKGNVNLKQLGLPSARLGEGGQPGYVEENHLRRHVPVVTGYAKTGGHGEFSGLGWIVLLRMDRSDVLAPIRTVLWRVGLAGAILWVPTFCLLLWVVGSLRTAWANLEKSEEWLATTLCSIGDAVIAADSRGIVTFLNPVAESLTGWTLGEAKGRGLDEVFRIMNEETRRPVESPVTKVLRSGLVVGLANHTVLIAKDGTERPIDDSGAPIKDDRGMVVGVVLVFHDITERRRAERRRNAEYAVTRVLSESASIEQAAPAVLQTICEGLGWDLGLLWRADRQVNLLRCRSGWHRPSDPVASFLAHSQDRTFSLGVGLPGRVWMEGKAAWIPDVLRDPNFPREPLAAQAGLRGAFAFPILLGREVLGLLEFYSRQTRQPDEDLLAMMTSVGRQIGQFIERTEAEAALADEKERLTVTLRSIGDGVITTDAKGRVVLLNEVAETLTGWTSDEALGRPLAEIFHIINEHTRQRCRNPVERVLETGGIVGLANHTILIAQDGTERNLADSGAPIRARDGTVIGVVLVFRDVTDQLRMEQELLIARKLEAVGVLAGGIAHDFNNILTAILGNLALAKQSLPQDDRLFRRLTEAEKATLRATGLTKQLLTFARGGEPVKRPTAIGALLNDWASFALRGSNVRCECAFPADLWNVNIDEGQMSQVVHNLVINAQQAMPDGGVVRIDGENVTIGAGSHELPLREGRYVKVSIQDQGTGIQPEHLAKIFDPYFTTKQTGSGLGLATSFSIVKNHEGHILAHSKVGVGTTLSIYLPACFEPLVPEAAPAASPQMGQGWILIMDDEEAIRGMLRQMLVDCGYDVDEAWDGAHALALYKRAMEAGRPYDAVIMDLTIPGGMGGKETMAKLLELDPGVKAVVSSGYATDPVMANYRAYGFLGMVTKPYHIVELSRILHQVLTEDRARRQRGADPGGTRDR